MILCNCIRNFAYHNYILSNIKLQTFNEIIYQNDYSSINEIYKVCFYYKNNNEFKICLKEAIKLPKWKHMKKILQCFLTNNYNINTGIIIKQNNNLLIFKNINYIHNIATIYKFIEF